MPPLIDLVKVPNPLALPNGPGPVTYTYTLRNIGTVPVTDITMVGDTCAPIQLASGDVNGDAILNLTETWVYTCSTVLTSTHTNIVTATGWANGISAVDIASATVVVGAPAVPPLIHLTKIPSPLALTSAGGYVTYTETVTNPGAIALANIRLVDDKCAPMKYISGDVNGDSRLDTTEGLCHRHNRRGRSRLSQHRTPSGKHADRDLHACRFPRYIPWVDCRYKKTLNLMADERAASYHGNIVADARENNNFRRVVHTGKQSQLVVMSVPSGTDVGKETHARTEQTLFFLSGTGEAELDGEKFPVGPGTVVVVVPGTEHNFMNTGSEDLKIFTVYAPPNHIDGRIHATKVDADADTEDEAVGEAGR